MKASTQVCVQLHTSASRDGKSFVTGQVSEPILAVVLSPRTHSAILQSCF